MAARATRLAADSLRVLPRKRISRLIGRVADVPASGRLLRPAVRAFTKVYDIDLDEAVIPDGGFASFDAFFTRRLRPGTRPVDPDPAAVLSPADGRVEDLGEVGEDAVLRVKGRPYRVSELLGGDEAAARFDGGRFFIVYLSPRDYHRVHAPVSGPVVRVRHVPGTLYPVNSIGLDHVPNLFARNERVAMFQQSPEHGLVASVMVGAIGVGRISLSFDELTTNVGRPGGVRRYGRHAPEMDRADELGVFHLGSTVIVFLAAGAGHRLVVAAGARVRVGEAVARRSPT